MTEEISSAGQKLYVRPSPSRHPLREKSVMEPSARVFTSILYRSSVFLAPIACYQLIAQWINDCGPHPASRPHASNQLRAHCLGTVSSSTSERSHHPSSLSSGLAGWPIQICSEPLHFPLHFPSDHHLDDSRLPATISIDIYTRLCSTFSTH